MAVVDGRLANFKDADSGAAELLTWYWVVGPRGAVSTWFSDTTAVLGYSVCSGASVHSPRPVGDAEFHGPCRFLETDCWCETGTALGLEGYEAAFDSGDDDAIYAWLTAEYAGRFADVTV